MTKFQVTLADLRKAGACISGYNRLVRSLQGLAFSDDDKRRETYIKFAHKEQISLLYVLDSNGLDDSLWAARCIKGAKTDRDLRLFAVWCAREVQHLMADDQRKALDVAERHGNGEATDDELAAARDAAWAAARDAQKEMFIKMCKGWAPWQLDQSK